MLVAVTLGGVSRAQAADKDKLVGAWHLISLKAPGEDGKLTEVPDLTGILIYTRDGHMSVQLRYPKAASGLNNDYVKNGYEASFGSYDVDDAAHTVTHHVQGSITDVLIGKDLPRAFQLSGKQLIIQSTRPDEHWSVTWEHY
jgi:hypothetical protein